MSTCDNNPMTENFAIADKMFYDAKKRYDSDHVMLT